jgi:hypothetical protein
MSIKIKGFDEVHKKLKQLSDNAKKLDGEHNIPFDVLFNNKFMSRHTNFSSIDDFIKDSGFEVSSQEDFAKIPDTEWDIYVRSNSRFQDWSKMMEKATAEYVAKQLGF